MDEDQLEVEVPVDEAVEVEIVDDTPDEEKQPPKKVESTPDPDSVDEMSERVQKRIKKLTFEKHETARQLAAREREHSALVNFTQGVHLSAKQLADRATRAEAAWKAEAAARREAELKLQQAKFVTARESNDAATEAEISAAMAKIRTRRSCPT